ncbi:MAG: class II aldolase/adducin family protein [Microbacterium gubbeenense]
MSTVATPSRLAEIVELSRTIAEPHRELVILAEGNTSVRSAPDRMIVKATGSAMELATERDFVEVDLDAFWRLIDSDHDGDAVVDELFRSATLAGAGRPSVESLLHAVCQRVAGVDTVIHTHPTAVNAVLCSDQAELLVEGALFPDQIVVLGRRPMLVPYVDPGLPLAREVNRLLVAHIDAYGERPRAIYLRNHGLFALGSSVQDAVQITDMAVKCARILTGASTIGAPVFLAEESAERIDTRPDELLRRRMLDVARTDVSTELD